MQLWGETRLQDYKGNADNVIQFSCGTFNQDYRANADNVIKFWSGIVLIIVGHVPQDYKKARTDKVIQFWRGKVNFNHCQSCSTRLQDHKASVDNVIQFWRGKVNFYNLSQSFYTL